MSHHAQTVGVNLLVERASVDVASALRRAGVRSILLKGPLQQRWLMGAGPARPTLDIDLLVERVDLERAESVVAGLGYRPAVELPTESGFEHSHDWIAAGRVPIELHWSLVGVDDSRVWAVLSAETEMVNLGGKALETPKEAARCLIVALHAAQHGAGAAEIVRDLDRALEAAGNDVWERALELARAVRAETPFVAALSLTRRGRTLIDLLGLSLPTLSEREALALITPAPTGRGFFFLSNQRGARAKCAFLARKIAPPREFMRLRYQVAERGPVGLGLAYLGRPFWLARWALPGLRSWQRAKRMAEETRTRGSAGR